MYLLILYVPQMKKTDLILMAFEFNISSPFNTLQLT